MVWIITKKSLFTYSVAKLGKYVLGNDNLVSYFINTFISLVLVIGDKNDAERKTFVLVLTFVTSDCRCCFFPFLSDDSSSFYYSNAHKQ